MKALFILTLVAICSFSTYGQSFDKQIIKDDLSGSNGILFFDFNDDGTSEYIVVRNSEQVVTMVYNDGTELIERDLLNIDGPIEIVRGDFNNDGKVDLALASTGTSGLTILKNIGDLEFEVQSLSIPDYESAQSLAVADIDLDNDLDLIISSPNSADIIIVEMVDTSNFIFEYRLIDIQVDIKDMNIADLDNDGLPDIIGTNFFEDELIIYYNQENLNFQKTIYPVPGAIFNNVGDLNNDGLLDIVVTTFGDNELYAFINNGDKTFREKLVDNPVERPLYISCFDVNLDGNSDIVVGTDEGLVVYLIEDIDNNLWVREEYPQDGWVGSFDIVDVDSDEDLDIIASSIAVPGIILYENLVITSAVHELVNAQVVIYPNPTTDMINIEIDGQLEYQVLLYNSDGKLIRTGYNVRSMNIENVVSGTYLLEVKEINTSKSIVGKIIIEK